MLSSSQKSFTFRTVCSSWYVSFIFTLCFLFFSNGKEKYGAHSSLRTSDNTNADPETRIHWINLAREVNVPIRCIYITAPPELCKHNNAVRAANRDMVRYNPWTYRIHHIILPPMYFYVFTHMCIYSYRIQNREHPSPESLLEILVADSASLLSAKVFRI